MIWWILLAALAVAGAWIGLGLWVWIEDNEGEV